MHASRKISRRFEDTALSMAEQLVISPKTVDTHRTHIMDKLNLHSRAELVKYAMRRGLLED